MTIPALLACIRLTVVTQDISVTLHRVCRISEILVPPGSSSEVVEIVKPQPCHDVLERCDGVCTADVTAEKCYANSYCSRDKKETEHCLTRSDANFLTYTGKKKGTGAYLLIKVEPVGPAHCKTNYNFLKLFQFKLPIRYPVPSRFVFVYIQISNF